MHSSPPDTAMPPATTRTTVPFDASSAARFTLPKKKRYAPQYAHIYFCRLTTLRPALLKAAHRTLGPPSPSLRYADRIVDASSDSAAQTVIAGVVFRHMPEKPSILTQYEQASHDLIPAPPPRATARYPSDADKVFLEDENGRCTLDVTHLHPLPDAFVTGVVLAVRGAEDRATGAFRVSAYASALPAPQPSLPSLPADTYLCLVSGLSLTGASLPAELLLEFLKGSTGDQSEETFAASIAHLVIAGNVTPPPSVTPSHKPLAVGDKERIASPIVEADRYLSALASSLPVSMMPGENDPANCLLPQQPLHRCLLPSASRNANLSRVPNPFSCALGGRLLLATSGQNVSDFALYEPRKERTEECAEGKVSNGAEHGTEANGKSEGLYEPSGDRVLEILEAMLNNRHVAPTCPDTLGSYPFYEQDPFIVETTPHVFIAGNQREFATRLMKVPVQGSQETDGSMEVEGVETGRGVRLISVPRFDCTGQAVLVNLRTLECTVREFALTM